jgi:hypothetical protein
MARRVFFSFDFSRDLWRVNVVRNTGAIDGISAGGFGSGSLQEDAKSGDAIKRLIDEALQTTSVTVVLIGAETANRPYVSYEIEKAIERGNPIVGIRIHNIKDENGNIDPPGAVPAALNKIGAPVYNYEYGKIGEWVEHAIEKSPVE